MRVSAIQGSNSVYAKRNNKVQSQIRKTMDTPVSDAQSQAVNFKGGKTYAVLGGIGAALGAALLGPAGLIIGAAVGIQGAQYAEQDEELKKEKDKANKKK